MQAYNNAIFEVAFGSHEFSEMSKYNDGFTDSYNVR